MGHTNIEFKATAENIEKLEQKLLTLNPTFVGLDHQIDTYYNTNKGRLKLREGNIENALIWYDRVDFAGAKQSDIILYKHKPDAALKAILTKTHGVKVVVDKLRKIYFVKNVKFHFDIVEGLGTFVEVEAIDSDSSINIEILKEQCDYYTSFFEIDKKNFIEVSYSDLLMQKEKL